MPVGCTCVSTVLLSDKECAFTHGLQMEVDKIEAVVLHGLVRFSRNVQVSVALLVAQVHLYF